MSGRIVIIVICLILLIGDCFSLIGCALADRGVNNIFMIVVVLKDTHVDFFLSKLIFEFKFL